MIKTKLPRLWLVPVLLISSGFGLLTFFFENPYASFVSYSLIVIGFIWLLLWADSADRDVHVPLVREGRPSPDSSLTLELKEARLELAARIQEIVEFKAELDANRKQIDALKSCLNRTEVAELNEAIAQLYISLEFERGRADGDFAQILSGLSESVDALFSAAGLVKGAPTPGERFIDQPAGSCKVFKTELTSDAALKGTIKAVRSPWVGFMANGKLKVITASNVSVYA